MLLARRNLTKNKEKKFRKLLTKPVSKILFFLEEEAAKSAIRD
jgi:hypothetical protein